MKTQPLQNRIREVRILKGIVRQLSFCKMIGKTKAAVSSWENNHTQPGLKTGLLIANALGCSLEELFIYDLSAETPKIDECKTALPVDETLNESLDA